MSFSLGYYDRLRKLGLTTLETRRLHGDIIEVFKKNFKGFENVSYNTYFTLSRLRGHSYKLYKPNFRLDIRKFSFSVRVINIWNAPPYCVLYYSVTLSIRSSVSWTCVCL